MRSLPFSRFRSAAPYLILLFEVFCFHWKTIAGKTIIPWDIRTYHLPQAIFVARSFLDRELPLWNPFIYCGHPFSANIQAALFYPPRLLAILVGSGGGAHEMLYVLECELILHVFLAGSFSYLLMREIGLGTVAALVGATSFELGGFFASQAEHLGAIETAAWLPLIWLCLVRLSRAPSVRSALLLSLGMAMSILAGFTPLTFVALLASTLFALVLSRLNKIRRWPSLLTYFACAAGALLLSAVSLIPAIQLTLLSVGRYRTDWIGTGGGLPLASLLSLVSPNTQHILDRGQYHGSFDITFLYLYCGAVTIAGIALLFFRRQRPYTLLFAAMAGASGLLMLGDSTPPGKLFATLLPPVVRGAIYPLEWTAPFLLCLCILGAMGLQSIRSRWILAGALALAFLDLTWFGSNRPMNSTSWREEPGVTESEFHGSPALLRAVQQHASLAAPSARIDTVDDSIDWVGSATITGLPTAGGEDPMALLRYIQVRLAATPGERWGYYYQVKDVSSPVLHSLNVCCLLSRSPIVSKSIYDKAQDVPGGFLYSTDNQLPRFHMVYNTVYADKMESAVRLLNDRSWNPKETAIVEGVGPQAGVDGFSRVDVLSYRRNAVRLVVETEHPGFLVSSEANFPGWDAKLDAHSIPIYNTNVAFRGIEVPAGRHTVEFAFRPGILLFSFVVSAVAWLVWAFLLFRRTLTRPVILDLT